MYESSAIIYYDSSINHCCGAELKQAKGPVQPAIKRLLFHTIICPIHFHWHNFLRIFPRMWTLFRPSKAEQNEALRKNGWIVVSSLLGSSVLKFSLQVKINKAIACLRPTYHPILCIYYWYENAQYVHRSARCIWRDVVHFGCNFSKTFIHPWKWQMFGHLSPYCTLKALRLCLGERQTAAQRLGHSPCVQSRVRDPRKNFRG